MNARQLLRFYPSAWRARYGDEFLALLDDRPLRAGEVIDVALGALDAHLTSTTRTAAMEASGGSMSMVTRVCARSAGAQISTRTALISAALMIGTTMVLMGAGIFAKRSGWLETGEFLVAIAFPASMLTSMPVMYLRNHSWRVHVVMVGGPLVILSLITWLSVRF